MFLFLSYGYGLILLAVFSCVVCAGSPFASFLFHIHTYILTQTHRHRHPSLLSHSLSSSSYFFVSCRLIFDVPLIWSHRLLFDRLPPLTPITCSSLASPAPPHAFISHATSCSSFPDHPSSHPFFSFYTLVFTSSFALFPRSSLTHLLSIVIRYFLLFLYSMPLFHTTSFFLFSLQILPLIILCHFLTFLVHHSHSISFPPLFALVSFLPFLIPMHISSSFLLSLQNLHFPILSYFLLSFITHRFPFPSLFVCTLFSTLLAYHAYHLFLFTFRGDSSLPYVCSFPHFSCSSLSFPFPFHRYSYCFFFYLPWFPCISSLPLLTIRWDPSLAHNCSFSHFSCSSSTHFLSFVIRNVCLFSVFLPSHAYVPRLPYYLPCRFFIYLCLLISSLSSFMTDTFPLYRYSQCLFFSIFLASHAYIPLLPYCFRCRFLTSLFLFISSLLSFITHTFHIQRYS